MSVFVGGSEVKEAFVGSTEVKEMWVGGDRVWTNVPDINFAPDQWTSGAAGTVWSFYELETPPPPSWNTSYVEITHSLKLSGSFFIEYSGIEADVVIPSSGNYTITAVVSAMSTSLSTSSDRVELTATSFGSDTITSPGTLTVSATGLSEGDNINIKLYNPFNVSGNSSGQSGYARITEVYMEKD